MHTIGQNNNSNNNEEQRERESNLESRWRYVESLRCPCAERTTQQQVYKKTQKIKSNQIKIHTFTAHLVFEFPLKAEPLASCITLIEIIIISIAVATNK